MLKCPRCGTENRQSARFCNDCGHMITDELKGNGTLGRGTLLNKYSIVNLLSFELGESLYIAEDRHDESLKFIKEIITILPDQKLQARATDRFNREMQILSKISFPSLPVISDYFVEKGHFYTGYYIVFNFVEGELLDSFLSSPYRDLPQSFAVDLGCKLCDVLEFFHNYNPPLFTYNLSPSNVIIKKNSNNILITDIPVSRPPQGRNMISLPQWVEFVSPERYEGKTGIAGDIYALGALIHYILTGARSVPFVFKPLRSVKADISQELETVVATSLRLKPEKRFPSASAMKKELLNKGEKSDGTIYLDIDKQEVSHIKSYVKPEESFRKDVSQIRLEEPFKKDMAKSYVKPEESFRKDVSQIRLEEPFRKDMTKSYMKGEESFRKETSHIKLRAEESLLPSVKAPVKAAEIEMDRTLLNWYVQTEDKVSSSPIAVDDTVYVGSDDKNVYAISADNGKIKWTFKTGSWVSTSPAFYNNKIYIGSRDGKVYSLNIFNGKKEWEFRGEETVFFNPSVDQEQGILLIGASLYERGHHHDEVIFGINAESGSKVWGYKVGASVFHAPFLSGGIAYVGTEGGTVISLDVETGKEIWKFETGGRIYASPVISEDIIYIACEGLFNNGIVILLNAEDGRHIWTMEFEKPFRSSVCVGEDIVYIGSLDKNLYAIDLEKRNILWKFETKGGIRCTPVLYQDIVYTGSDDGWFYAVNAMTGEKLWHFDTGGALRSSPALLGDSIYFGSRDGKIYSLKLVRSEAKMTEPAKKETENITKEDKIFHDLLKKANILAGENRLTEALPLFQDLLKMDPSNHSVLLSTGDIYFALSDWKKAVSYYEKLLRSNMSDEVLARYGKALFHEKDYQKAIELLEDIKEPELSVIKMLADSYRIAGDIDKAIQNYEKVTHVDSRSPEIYVTLGKMYSLKGDIEAAHLAYDMALDLDKEFVPAFLGNIQLLIIEKKYEDALQLITACETLSTDTDNMENLLKRKGQIFLELGKEYLEKNEIATATGYLEQAEKLPLSVKQMDNLKKSKAQIFFKLAETYSDENKLGEAIKFYKMCEDIYPDSEIARLARKRRELRE